METGRLRALPLPMPEAREVLGRSGETSVGGQNHLNQKPD